MCILFGYNPQIIFCHKMNLVIFLTKGNSYQVSCMGNSSYSFMPIVLKLYRYFGHGLEMCVCLGYNPQIFCYSFSQIEFSGVLDIY